MPIGPISHRSAIAVSILLAALLLVVGVGALETYGTGFGVAFIVAGIAYLAVASGIRSGAVWAAPLGRVLGLATIFVAAVLAIVGLAVLVGESRGLDRALYALAGGVELSGSASLLLLGGVAAGAPSWRPRRTTAPRSDRPPSSVSRARRDPGVGDECRQLRRDVDRPSHAAGSLPSRLGRSGALGPLATPAPSGCPDLDPRRTAVWPSYGPAGSVTVSGRGGLSDPWDARSRLRRQGRRAGPPKRRALLAILLLQANEIVLSIGSSICCGRSAAPAGRPRDPGLRLRAAAGAQPLAGGEVIVWRTPGYLLAIDPESVDARQVERLVSDGARRFEAGDLHEAATVLDRPASFGATALSDLASRSSRSPRSDA